MTKMIKMSLVAAVAVAGLTTTSSAASLEEAIKGVDVSGYVRYRLNTTHTKNASTDANEESKAVVKLGMKVNDAVKANLKVVALADTTGGSDAANNNKGSTSAPVNLTEANFVINAGPATLIAGLQTSQSPFFANNGDTRSHGVTALVPAGPVTVAAAHYTTTTAISAQSAGQGAAATNDISALGAIAKFGPVNVEAWYATVHNTEVSDIAVLASTKVGPATVSMHHAELDTAANLKISNTQLAASMKAGPANVLVAYVTTGKDSGDTTVDGDSDSKLVSGLETITTKAADVDAIVIGASAPVGPVKLGLTYLMVDNNTANANGITGTSASEYKFTVGYAMSKNFNVSAFYDSADLGAANDTTVSRIEVKYTF